MEEEALKQKIALLDKLHPIERLLTLLNDPLCALRDYPEEWARIPIDFFEGMNSIQLTGILRLFANHIGRKEKSSWKDLRSRLYLIRQRVYNQEHFRRLSSENNR